MNKQIEALAHAYKEVTEKYHSKKKTDEELKGDQHKLDANGNGKIDGDDFKKLRKGKKGEETAEMNPKVSTDKTSTEGVKESMTIREKLLSVLEKKDNHSPNQDKAEKPEAALKGAGAIQMKADLGPMTPVLDAEKIAADDVKAVDKSSKVSPKNSTDKNAKGDKNIINKPEDVTQKGGFKESFSNLVQAMREAGQKMYAPEVEEEQIEEDLEQVDEVSMTTKGVLKKRVEKQAAAYTTADAFRRRAQKSSAKAKEFKDKADSLPKHHQPRASGGDYFRGSAEHEKLMKKAQSHTWDANFHNKSAQEHEKRADAMGKKIGKTQAKAYPKLANSKVSQRRADDIAQKHTDRMRDKHFATTTDYDHTGKEKRTGKQHSQYPKEK